MYHLFVSPHADDAILSCGGTIASLAEPGEAVTVLTLFIGDVDPPFSPLAESIHYKWGLAEGVPAARRLEDRAAVESLGASVDFADALDAIYRRDDQGNWLYLEEGSLGRAPHPADAALRQRLADAVLERIPRERTRLYFPLAVGRHPDHTIVLEVGEALAEAGHDALFFEDYPYIRSDEAYWLRMEEIAGWSPTLRLLDERQVAAKIAAIRLYASQIGMLFPNEDVEEAVRLQLQRTAGTEGSAAERFWKPPQKAR
jgi:LmbE family N-acetylglucosaminyl deacetylase